MRIGKAQRLAMDQAIGAFVEIEHTLGKQIDPDDEHDFHSIAIGYFLGKNWGVTLACIMARVAVYKTDLDAELVSSLDEVK